MIKLGDLLSPNELKTLSVSIENNQEDEVDSKTKKTTAANNATTLDDKELKLLRKYYLKATALESGNRCPITYSDRHFVAVCKGKALPISPYEKVYLKYMKSRELEKKKIEASKHRGRQVVKYTGLSTSDEGKAEIQRRKENGEALLKMQERKKERERGYLGTNIPEHEEGTPKPGWFTDDDWKRMRSRDYADMKNRQKE